MTMLWITEKHRHNVMQIKNLQVSTMCVDKAAKFLVQRRHTHTHIMSNTVGHKTNSIYMGHDMKCIVERQCSMKRPVEGHRTSPVEGP
jgi:hypothetical protein